MGLSRAAIERRSKLRRRYGVTPEWVDEAKKKQRHRCAICRRKRYLVVDHCHASKDVRGMLCRQCNVCLGHMRDDPRILRRAAKYLEEAAARSHDTR